MNTPLTVASLVLCAALLFGLRYYRAKRMMKILAQRVIDAQTKEKAANPDDKDRIATAELLRFAAERRYNHFTFRDIIYMLSDELISSPAKEAVLADMRQNPCRK